MEAKLNKIERLKRQLPPSAYYPKLQELPRQGQIRDQDLFYLKNFGIYADSRDPHRFMVRFRIPGGRVSHQALRTFQELVQEFQATTILTTRAQIELHDLTLSQAIEAHERMGAVGVTSLATLMDNVRTIVTDPFDGLTPDSLIHVYPIIRQLETIALDQERLGMLPRKFNTAIIGTRKPLLPLFAQDFLLLLARKGERLGFNLYLGGKNTHPAQPADIFVTPHQVPSLFTAVLETYMEHGLRASRTRARLWHLLEAIGLSRFKEYLAERIPFEAGGEVLVEGNPPDRLPPHQVLGQWGRIDLTQIDLHGVEAIRIGANQRLYLFGQGKRVWEGSERIGVCAGSRHCLFALFDTKEEAQRMGLELLSRHKLVVGVSGCLKGCGRHIMADMGFVAIRTNLFGRVERGVRLYLGGEYRHQIQGARLIYWAIPLRKLPDMVATIIDDYLASGEESFQDYTHFHLNRFSAPFLGYFFLAKRLTRSPITLASLQKEEDPFSLKLEGSWQERIKALEYRLYRI
ncbi:MAG: hypothetical protein C6I00_01820 [Nitratiruptor sp.]|nr:hypothetical protein [Nitratiruptor sp.]NPA83337.1 nitrite/sulfite reductase [Campylobacterota bacterium]